MDLTKFQAGLKLLGLETTKLGPLIAVLVGYVAYYKDQAQIELAFYYLTMFLLVLTVMQVVRKFMFPSFSVEAHMKAALDNNNPAAAVVVLTYFSFLFGLCYLLTQLLQATIRPPV